jgi:hypothetical protein
MFNEYCDGIFNRAGLFLAGVPSLEYKKEKIKSVLSSPVSGDGLPFLRLNSSRHQTTIPANIDTICSPLRVVLFRQLGSSRP